MKGLEKIVGVLGQGALRLITLKWTSWQKRDRPTVENEEVMLEIENRIFNFF